jgi:type I restriction enzyme R subunit
MEARGKALIGNEVSDSIHRKLYAATQRPTDVFNSRLAELKKGIDSWEKAYDKAHKEGDKKAENYAEGLRSELTTEREGLMRFKSDLARFVRTYNYIAQLIELSDASLENFAAFAKLFSKRLKGITPEQVDLTGLVLKGFALKRIDSEGGDEDPTKLKPLVANPSDPTDREKEFLSEIIQRMNDIFGDVSDDTDQRYFTAQVANAVQKDEVVVEQIDKNSRNQALQGNIADVVRHASVKSMKAHGDNAKAVLSDPQNMEAFLGLIYDIVKHKNVDEIIRG